jgi:hypothetical protein
VLLVVCRVAHLGRGVGVGVGEELTFSHRMRDLRGRRSFPMATGSSGEAGGGWRSG